MMKINLALPPNSIRVIIVEDDPTMKTALNHVIRRVDRNARIKWVSSVRDAVHALAERRYSLIIADYLLEESRTGYDLWRICRRYYRDIPFLMMSSTDIHRIQANAGRLNTSPMFLPKPLDWADCYQVTRALIQSRQSKTATYPAA